MLDLLMPDVNGFDVVEVLSGNEATKMIPIMVLTAKSLTRAEIDQLNGHVSAILKRGSTGAVALISQLRAVLNRRAVEA
jgi:DNA-binding response OmpR family regulator